MKFHKSLSQLVSFQSIFFEIDQTQIASFQIIKIQFRQHFPTKLLEQFKVFVDVVDSAYFPLCSFISGVDCLHEGHRHEARIDSLSCVDYPHFLAYFFIEHNVIAYRHSSTVEGFGARTSIN